MRDNSERSGLNRLAATGGSEPTTPSEPSEPKSSFPSPTEFVELPSKGLYYPEGSPLKDKESLELKFATAKEEDILTNKSLLKKGLAIDRLLSSLLVDKTIAIDDLLIGDKNALLIAARISAYGADYKTSVVCPQCSHKFEFNFDLNQVGVREVSTGLSSNGTVIITLPKTKAAVTCRLLTGRDEKYMTQQAEMKKKHNLAETPLTDQLKLFIVSVNGSCEKTEINRFIETLPAFDSRFLRMEYVKNIPDINTDFNITCPECDTDSEVSLPLTAAFFWPK
jgi:hypothetical protein